MLSTVDCFVSHWVNAASLIDKSLSVNTRKAYVTGWKTFHSQLKLSYGTIKTYLSGVQHFLSLQDLNRPSIFSAHSINAILRGIRRSSPPSSISRLPILEHIFRSMSDLLTRSPFGRLLIVVLKATIYLAFYGFLKPGEFTRTSLSSRVLTISHLVRHPDHFRLHLVVCKMQQFGAGTDVTFFKTDSAWCPIAVLDQLIALVIDRARLVPCYPPLMLPSRQHSLPSIATHY